MRETLELNRFEYLILATLYSSDCKNCFKGMTISEILEASEGCLGARMTVYKKLRKLVDAGYIAKGILDNHADTFYLTEKGIDIVEEGK